ncbi:GRAM domain-containing protein 2B-like [Thrips palmi]|uniref:GRAM domain-containing protein 2B-like n=1 Tax=Thrips palmi TaxID=161013 RepID=A0A6P8YPZ8_THRPL|nr:GRAM domain-containing protein 2B-like [Thrips palmi]
MPTATANMKMLSIAIPRPSKALDDASWSSTSPSESPLSTSASTTKAMSGPKSAPALARKESPWTFTRESSYRASMSSSWVVRRRQSAQETSSRRRAPGPPTVAPSVSTPTLVPLPSPATSKARHKKFHRHFDSVAADERVLNYYSCALISDILLQGHLYITSNYFAFYSNVFGYVTKVLIPTASVLKVSKEKTARIIPNAVGVATSDEKHVFGSLLSRDNTYKLMVQVWKTALGSSGHPPSLSPQPAARALPVAKDLKDEADSASASGDVLQEDDDSSLSGDAGLPPVPLDKIPIVAATLPVARSASAVSALAVVPGASATHTLSHAAAGPSSRPSARPSLHDAHWGRSPRQTFVLSVSAVLVAFLLVSTAFLYYRMSRIQDQFRINSGDNLYQDLARWQNHLHTRSAGQVEEFLNTHLDQLAKVRKSLEALTMLIVSNDEDRMQQADSIIHQHHSSYQDQKHSRPPSLGKDAKES